MVVFGSCCFFAGLKRSYLPLKAPASSLMHRIIHENTSSILPSFPSLPLYLPTSSPRDCLKPLLFDFHTTSLQLSHAIAVQRVLRPDARLRSPKLPTVPTHWYQLLAVERLGFVLQRGIVLFASRFRGLRSAGTEKCFVFQRHLQYTSSFVRQPLAIQF